VKELRNRTAIVTGASRGIGAAIAEVLAREGCNVVLAARSSSAVHSLADRLRVSYNVQTLAVPVDMADEQQVRDLVATAEMTFGGVDILVNNAGSGIFGAIDEVHMTDLREVFDVNFFGAVAAMQAVVPQMRRRGGGAIVNVSSIVGKFPQPLGGGYSATKYALQAVSGAARAELARDNIAVTLVCPGLTDTEFARHARVSIPGAERTRGERQAPIRGVPPMRVAERTLRAIRRGEREVYITLPDRLLVWAAQTFPWLLDWGLRLAVRIRRRRFELSRLKNE
jgi:short-subunit dehydrogenase